jgi:hypothetical protein
MKGEPRAQARGLKEPQPSRRNREVKLARRAAGIASGGSRRFAAPFIFKPQVFPSRARQ